jgi:FAD synthase
MKIIYNSEQGIENNIALTFVNFYGVHLGHEFAQTVTSYQQMHKNEEI